MRRRYSALPAARAEYLLAVALTFAAAALRIWMAGQKGLGYDESTSALIARAPVAEIIRFHWLATYEHPPLWILLMHAWSGVFGQSEAALRLPSVLAGTLAVPLLWQVTRAARLNPGVRILAVALAAVSPLLVLYSQDARMYAVANLLAVASVYLFIRLTGGGGAGILAGFVLVNWAMTGFQYYFTLLIGIEGLFLLVSLQGARPSARRVFIALALSATPILLWGWLSPGFRATLGAVPVGEGEAGLVWLPFLERTWKDLTFGAVRWQPALAAAGYLFLPFFFIGAFDLWRGRVTHSGDATAVSPPGGSMRWGRFFVLIVLGACAASLLVSAAIFTRYILFIAPFFCVVLAAGLGFLRPRTWPLAAAGLGVVLAVSFLGLRYYFVDYQKSAYREMAFDLMSKIGPGDAVLLESPRQHLLAKYYLPGNLTIIPVPDVTLPDYWPVSAPPIVPGKVGEQLRQALARHSHLWLILTAEDEVDRGEFAQKYLVAVSYRQNCRDWFNVTLCHFVAPGAVRPLASLASFEASGANGASALDITFGDALRLAGAKISIPERPRDEHVLLTALDWQADAKPPTDYKVTLRLVGSDGQVVSQADDLPVGALLPPTTWQAGDRKTGYMVLPVPAGLAPGEYSLVLGVYDPATLKLVPAVGGQAGGPTSGAADMITLTKLRIGPGDPWIQAGGDAP